MSSFCPYLRLVLQVVAWAISGTYSVFLGLPLHMQKVYMLKNSWFVFSLLNCLLLQGLSTKNSEGQRRNFLPSPTVNNPFHPQHRGTWLMEELVSFFEHIQTCTCTRTHAHMHTQCCFRQWSRGFELEYTTSPRGYLPSRRPLTSYFSQKLVVI